MESWVKCKVWLLFNEKRSVRFGVAVMGSCNRSLIPALLHCPPGAYFLYRVNPSQFIPAKNAITFSHIAKSCNVLRFNSGKKTGGYPLLGYWIGGFGLGESMNERTPLLNAVTDNIPEQKPRKISGLELPEEVLQGISSGVDLFHSTYVYHLTLGGFALTFPLDGIGINVSNSELSDIGSDGTKINLKATVYRKDTSPIVDDCRCYTCQNHTKAYINHLLNVHEMLAQTLLEIHNTHHYLEFFRAIRKSIKVGRFEEFRAQFIKNRRELVFSASLSA